MTLKINIYKSLVQSEKILSHSYAVAELEATENNEKQKKTIKNDTSVMADLIIMSAIVHLQIDGYQF